MRLWYFRKAREHETHEKRPDGNSPCWLHCQIDEVRTFFKISQMPGSRHSHWTAGSFTTNHWHDSRLEAAMNVTELRFSLELCIVFRRFIPNFARMAALLNRKLWEDRLTPLERLAEDELLALRKLPQKLIVPPVLALPKLTGTSILDTDACDGQGSYVLLKKQPERPDKPVGYWSRYLNFADHAYDTTHKRMIRRGLGP